MAPTGPPALLAKLLKILLTTPISRSNRYAPLPITSDPIDAWPAITALSSTFPAGHPSATHNNPRASSRWRAGCILVLVSVVVLYILDAVSGPNKILASISKDGVSSSSWWSSSEFQPGNDSRLLIPQLVVEDVGVQGGETEKMMTVEEMREMVGKRNGVFVRDWSVWLGWNNVRYTIETALLHAQILNRTAILPSYVYARSCEFGHESCAAYFKEVNIEKWTDIDYWDPTPKDEPGGWIVPLELMIDLPRLRRMYGPVLLVSDYLRLHSIDPSIERGDGYWSWDNFSSSYRTQKLTYKAIDNWDYDPEDIIRVDDVQGLKRRGVPAPQAPESMRPPPNLTAERVWVHFQEYWDPEAWNNKDEPVNLLDLRDFITLLPSDIQDTLQKAVEGAEEAGDGKKGIVKGEGTMGWLMGKDAQVEVMKRWLEGMIDGESRSVGGDDGWCILRTYESPHPWMLSKSMQRIQYELARRSQLSGLLDQFGSANEDVLHLRGEIHLYRTPGSLRFTTSGAQEAFSQIVTHDLAPIPRILVVAEKLDKKMRKINGGRQWMGAHMRRGDFSDMHWVLDSNITRHVERVKESLEKGLKLLQDAKELNLPKITSKTYGAESDEDQSEYPLPLKGDRFFVATDERSPAALSVIREGGGILLSDLLTPEDRATFLGYPALVTDWLAVLEQAVLARGAIFFGSAMSSVSGGIANWRMGHGKRWETTILA